MTATSPQSPPHEWLHHLEDEADAAFLYRELALSPEQRQVPLTRLLPGEAVEVWKLYQSRSKDAL